MKALILFLALAVSLSAQEIKPPCVAIDADLLQPKSPFGALRIWGKPSKKWPRNATLRVKFLGGSSTLQKKVWKQIKDFDDLCGLTFVPSEDAEAEIRIDFKNTGNWSYIGKDCLTVLPNRQTMNLQITAWEFESEIRRLCHHELGHAVALGHELQSPRSTIKWNVPVVLEAYRKSQGWSAAQTRRQVIDREDDDDFDGTNFKPDSLMCYSIESRYTLNGVKTPWNTKLSKDDILFIQKWYPLKP